MVYSEGLAGAEDWEFRNLVHDCSWRVQLAVKVVMDNTGGTDWWEKF